MRVLHLTDRLSERGGADLHLLAVLRSQLEHHTVCLAAGRDDGNVTPPCSIEIIAGLDARLATDRSLTATAYERSRKESARSVAIPNCLRTIVRSANIHPCPPSNPSSASPPPRAS